MEVTKILERLVKREDLSQEEAHFVAELLANGEICQAQVAAFLVLLRAKGETGVELRTIAESMRKRSLKPSPPPRASKDLPPLVDVVGTGGDGHDTINVSTAAAVVASACGARVAKHGNRSASSRSGAADVLESLGVAMLEPAEIAACLDQCGICFVFAQKYHPALGHVAPVRKSLGVKTVFNILGPLLNPFEPPRMVLGVYSPHLLPVYADAVMGLHGVEHALLVHCCGLDEMAAVGPTQLIECKPHQQLQQEGKFDPLPFCEEYCTIADLQGGDADHNARVMRELLGGQSKLKHCMNTIAINAGACLYVSGLADSIHSGSEMARKCMQQGKALEKLDEWIKVSQQIQLNKRTKLDQ